MITYVTVCRGRCHQWRRRPGARREGDGSAGCARPQLCYRTGVCIVAIPSRLNPSTSQGPLSNMSPLLSSHTSAELMQSCWGGLVSIPKQQHQRLELQSTFFRSLLRSPNGFHCVGKSSLVLTSRWLAPRGKELLCLLYAVGM